MNKKTIIIALFALIAMAGQAKEKTIVWELPTTEYGNSYGDGFFYLALDVTKVELKDNETVVYITAQERSDDPDYSFQFAGDTYLKVGEQRYTIVSADGIELNKFVQTNKDYKRDIAFHFPPLPKGTKSFDFIEGDGQGAFQIKGIKPVEERWKQLFPSYWRDNNGDWKIAFFEDCAIYDCKFWNYKQRDVNQKTGEAIILMTNGNDELKVMVGKDKKGQRPIQIGSDKKVYSMITTRFLPDYPTKDTREGFVDTGYKEDTITVVGWIKDMPEQFKQLKTFEFGYEDLLTDKHESANADLDSLGRFTVKIPVLNSSEFFCDWRRCFMRTMLEPGKTYFLLYDFKEGRRYFMGDDCRLQNELFKYPLDWKYVSLDDGQDGTGEESLFDPYIVSVDSLLTAQYAYIDALCQQHPTLSTRFNLFRKGNTLWQQARAFGQARFKAKGFALPENARQFAYDTFWTKMEKPYTLHRDLSLFLRDYLDDAKDARNAVISYNLIDHYKDFARNDEELALFTQWKEWMDEADAEIESDPTPEAKIRKANELDSLNRDLIKKVDAIVQRPEAAKIINSGMMVSAMKVHKATLDSLGADPFIKDVWLLRQALSYIEYERTSMTPDAMDTVKAMIGNPLCIAMIEKQIDHYLAIENREFDKLVIKSSDNLADLSEGEALLKKILEPYKGKFVLLDIWGTWCSPCKEALSHSTEEYARLKDYDIQYLYLANRSPQTAWENVIKEYNVSGPNVAHYNLPAEQQAAIERHLNVHSWPTYKLFDRNGNLLDLEVDPRNLDGLARLLEQMK
jgi:thiol-disulfide isomerase/thioredoxin